MTNRIAISILLVAVAGSPFPFGSRDPGTVALWCGALAFGVACAPLHRLRLLHYWVLAGAAFVALAYAGVLHEQLAANPWIARVHPIWAEAEGVLGIPMQPSVSIVRNEPFFALGAPLANFLALVLGLLVGTDRTDARRVLKVFAWSGTIYAIYGIVALVFDPTQILWREKTAHVGNLTATFYNRNTAASYFGSVSVVWLLLLSEQIKLKMPDRQHKLGKFLYAMISLDPIKQRMFLVPFANLCVCLAALLLTVSRAGVVLSLLVLALGFLVFFRNRLPRGRSLVVFVGGTAMSMLLLLHIVGGTVSKRFELQGLVDAGRVAAWRSTLQLISEHPWFGTGLGTFAWAFPAYRSARISLVGVWDAAHSTPLELAAEIGLPLAIVIALAWFAAVALLGWGSFVRQRERIIPLSAFCIAILANLHSFVDFSLQVAGYSIVVFSLVGLGLAQTSPDAKYEN